MKTTIITMMLVASLLLTGSAIAGVACEDVSLPGTYEAYDMDDPGDKIRWEIKNWAEEPDGFRAQWFSMGDYEVAFENSSSFLKRLSTWDWAEYGQYSRDVRTVDTLRYDLRDIIEDSKFNGCMGIVFEDGDPYVYLSLESVDKDSGDMVFSVDKKGEDTLKIKLIKEN